MRESANHISDAVEKAKESRLNTFVAAAVALTATFSAICNVKDGNIVQAMQAAQANGVDTWAFYQSKSTKQHLAEQMMDQLTIQRDAQSAALPAEARAFYDKKIAEYAAQVKHYDVEKAEIKAKAEGFQRQYDELNVHDDQFDMAEASMSISIALFGVTALTQKRWLLAIGGAFTLLGLILGVAGFLKLGLHPDFLAKLLT